MEERGHGASQHRGTQSSTTGRPRRRSGGPMMGPAKDPKASVKTYSVTIEGDDGGIEMKHACHQLQQVIALREKYKSIDKGQQEPNDKLPSLVTLSVDDGVFQFLDRKTPVPWEQFYDDVIQVMQVIQNPQCRATCKYRLQVLEEKFNMYKISNAELEEGADRYRRGGGVFADSAKVDNCVNLASAVNAMNLLGHIQAVHDRDGEEVARLVGDRKEPQTLRRMFEVCDIQDPSQLTVEGLGLHPSTDKRLMRFDALDPDMNRAGKGCAEILRLFLTRKNLNDGQYLAEAVRPVLHRSENRSKYIECSELVVELLGTGEDDWEKLAKWINANNLDDCPGTNRWVVALPRQAVRRDSFAEVSEGMFEFHQKHIDNIFLPLFVATLAPEDPRNVEVARFLQQVGAIMIVSDEEVRESDFTRKRRKPAEVPWSENVCDLYFAYYVWANLASLNMLRRRKGLNVIQFRAAAGQRSTHLDSLVYSYLLGDAITQGLLLQNQHVLQYLYGIHKIGVCMSPVGQNALQIPYMDNPFPTFFRRGLMLSLCTEHPLYFHHSQDALVEEYATCTKLYKLAAVDMCELAHNSVIISSFPDNIKSTWLGDSYIHEGVKGNSIEHSNVPTPRLELRAESWATELHIILKAAGRANPSQDAPLLSAKLPYVVIDPHIQFPRVILSGPFERDTQHSQVAQQLHKSLELRKAYVWGARHVNRGSIRSILQQHDHIENAFKRNDTFDEDEWMFKTVEGIVVPHEVHQIPRLPKDLFRFDEFRVHISELRSACEQFHIKNFAIRRLSLLENKFKLHLAVNHSLEAGSTAEKASQNRDFYQATKVDTNVRMENGMTARHLLSFIISKANNNGDDIVSQEHGKEPQTLRQLLHDLRISPNFLTVDDLNVQVDATTASGSDQQFTPVARDPLLTLLLKTDNQMKGRYFAELTKLTFENFKRDKFTFAENRLPVYGANRDEWSLLSDWFDTHGMASVNNQWMVQIPRIYGFLKRNGKVGSFAEYIENIFQPLWSVSLHPSANPRLFHFVNHISGFDCIENEQRVDAPLSMATKPPQEWTSDEEPPYNYYLYYIWANVYTLNEFRQRRSFTTFSFRPSCGEAGSTEHLVGGFLLANAINYGVRLKDEPVLQYLCYLAQLGVAVCPLSNNTKVLDFLDNPFPEFFRRGLNVSLATEAPLQHHYTQEPLLEEYSIASKVWKLSPNDMCEIARNSVLQSGFDTRFKQSRLGELFFLSSSRSNDSNRTHLSDVRVAYRYDTYHTELGLLEHVSGLRFERAMATIDEESKKVQEWQEAKRKQIDTSLGGIIDSHQDEADIQKLTSQRALMVRQMEELKKNLQELQRQNKQLSEKLADETSRDQAAQQMRRQADADRVHAVSEAEARRSKQLETYEDRPFESSSGGSSEDEESEPSPPVSPDTPGGPIASGLDSTNETISSRAGSLVDSHHSPFAGEADESGRLNTQRSEIGFLKKQRLAKERTAALMGSPEDFFTQLSSSPLLIPAPKVIEGREVLAPSPPPRSGVSSVTSTGADDALSEFLKRSNVELDRMVTGTRRQSMAQTSRQVRVMSATETAFSRAGSIREGSRAPGGRTTSAR